MKTIAIHSHKGGVGKTTLSLALAMHSASKGDKVCVLDFDFIGCGMADLFKVETHMLQYVEEYFVSQTAGDFEIDGILIPYVQENTSLSIILNQGKGLLPGKPEKRLEEHMNVLRRGELIYGEIREKTGFLLRTLEDKGYRAVIIDCSPGLGYESATVTDLADLNVYLSTPNRSDCFGLLKEANRKRLDRRKSFLVLNRVEPEIFDLKAFWMELKNDVVVKKESRDLIGQLRIFGKDEDHFSIIPESQSIRTYYHIGGEGLMLPARREPVLRDCCNKILGLAGVESRS